VANCYDNEFFLESINIVQNISFTCKSWVQPNRLYPDKRIFFVNKVPSLDTMLCVNAYSYILLYTNYFWCTPCIYIIFNQVYLPCGTSNGLKELRGRKLKQLRGDSSARGRRRSLCDRIYEYDLGDPDKGNEYARPTLGGQHNPYPRRCRTESAPSKSGQFH